MKKKWIVIVALIFSASVAIGQSHLSQPMLWSQTNGPFAGSTNSLTVDSLQRIYVCTGGAGVYQSTDQGRTWHPRCQGLKILPIRYIESSSIEVGLNGTKVYVYALSHRNEIMRLLVNTTSTDAQWEYMNPNLGVSANITFNQMMTNAKGYFYLATSGYGILRSKDDGVTYDRPTTSIKDSTIQVLTADRNQNLYALTRLGTVYRSVDDGTSWQKLPKPAPYGAYVNAMVVGDDGSICIGYLDSTRVFRTTDMGLTWKKVFSLAPHKESQVDAMRRAVKGSDLFLNGHGPTYRSTDNGATWNPADIKKRGDEPFALVIDSLGYLYQCAIPDGVFRSIDHGMNWESMNPGLSVQHLDGGMCINSKGHIFTMSQFSMFRSTDDGNNWYTLPNELEEAFFPLLATDQEDLLYYATYDGLFRSKNNGETFDNIVKKDTNRIPPTNQIYNIAVSPKDELFVSSQFDMQGHGAEPWFARSKDHGNTWQRIDGIPTFIPIYTFAFSTTYGTTNDTMYASGNTPDIYRSINNGVNWEIVSNEGNGIKQFICHPDGSVFRLQPDSTGGIYRSVNGGKDWVKVFPPDTLHLPGNFTMMLDNTNKILLCTIDSGFYRSKNSDFMEWENLSTGFFAPDFYPNKPLNATQVVQNKKGVFFAGSRGASVYKSQPNLVADVPYSHLPTSVTEPQNYPNPFSTSTKIEFTVKTNGFVKVALYDMMGRQLQVLYSGQAEVGKHSMTFEAGSFLSNGKYLIVVQNANLTSSHWMTVTK